MKDLNLTILEAVNHILQDHPHLAPKVGELADLALSENRGGQKFFGLNNLDERLEKFLDYDGGYFVELGANNGIDQSNTFHFEKFRKWRGVLVEPIPHNFLACLKNRSKNTYVFCNACVSFGYTEKFVEILYSNLMSITLGVESDVEQPIEHAEAGYRYLNPSEKVFKFGAVAVTLNHLLQTVKAPRVIDLLSLDVEGAEVEVLRGIDHTSYRFKYLCVENRNFLKLESYLKEQGYHFLEQLTQHDYLFIDAAR